MPNEFKEIIMVQVGYFEPEPVTITGKGVYPSILMNIPRQEDTEFSKQLESEFEKKKQERENTLKRQ
jgi:hydrocephalus-inducing protein